jgi:succinate dehydrogenase / fumarate reductase cytochrome b subunit
MAQASPSGKNRPLSPHLQIWRWGPAMAVSILHRVSGNGLAVAGLGVLLWWLGALASGPDAYKAFCDFMWVNGSQFSWSRSELFFSLIKFLPNLVLIGISWAFFNHMASGIRHFFLDVGANFELNSNALWSILTPIIGILLTAAFWAALLLR